MLDTCSEVFFVESGVDHSRRLVAARRDANASFHPGLSFSTSHRRVLDRHGVAGAASRVDRWLEANREMGNAGRRSGDFYRAPRG